ncbi:MAG: hypothetical protein KA035_02975 [Candidatus Levybacteria bacterium]|nr:hypothetical protein [Candidatus Levybacteria bacterium]
MDPQSQFKQRYESFINSRKEQTQKATIPAVKSHHPFNKYYLFGLLIGALILLPGLFVILRNNTQQGTPIPPASQNPQVTAEAITDDEIYQELVAMVGMEAKEALNNPDLKSQARRNILKRRALQKISSTEDNTSIAQEDTPINYSLNLLQTELDLEKAVVTSRTADYVSTYVAPNNNYSAEAKKVKDNLEYIRTQMNQGKTVTQAYEALVQRLGADPKYNISQNAYITKDSGYSSGFVTTLFRTAKGKVTPVIESNKTDFMVAKIINAVNTKYNNLAAWEKENLK